MEEETVRARLPKGREVFGIIDARLGAGKFSVRCSDGKQRICRVPGRLRKSLWLYENNIVIVEPWEIQSDIRGDIIWKYTKPQMNWLNKKKMINF